MQTFKKWALFVIIICCVLAIALTYNHFYKTPIAKQHAKLALETYLIEKYPYEYYKVTDGAYNYQTKQFSFRVTSNAYPSNPVRMNVYDEKGYPIVKNTVLTLKEDKEASAKLKRQANAFLLALLKERASNVKAVDTNVTVYQSDLSQTLSWEPDFQSEDVPAGIQYTVWIDATSYTNEDMFEEVKRIHDTFLAQNIATNDLQIIGQQFVENDAVDAYKVTIKGGQTPTLNSVQYVLK